MIVTLAQVETMPIGSVIQTAEGDVWIRRLDDFILGPEWYHVDAGRQSYCGPQGLQLPARVLFRMEG